MYDITLGLNTGYTFTLSLRQARPAGRLRAPAAAGRTTTSPCTAPSRRRVRDNNHTWNFIDKITLGANLDGRDIYWNPTKGYYAAQSVTLVGGILFGQRHVHPHRLDASRASSRFSTFPCSRDWNCPGRARRPLLRVPHPAELRLLGPRRTWELADRHRLHRPAVHRRDDRGPRLARSMYGNALWDNKLELRMPISKDALWLVGLLRRGSVSGTSPSAPRPRRRASTR